MNIISMHYGIPSAVVWTKVTVFLDFKSPKKQVENILLIHV